MKKLTVAALIIGAFVIFSFLHSHSSSALLPSSGKLASTTAQQQPAPTTTTTGPAPSPTPTETPSTSAEATSPSPSPTATSSGGDTTSASSATEKYANGSYTGSVADAQWGYVQVRAIVQQGKITDVQFLQYPNDRSRSIYINQIADPELTSEAIQAQSAQVDTITGATDSSEAFIQSLSNALAQAQARVQTQGTVGG